ncbi:MAG: BREX-2 system phosphatase PglZ [Deltaproteobacteria bacterium]|nr:BREX-2 system phosphatase PglZ [Deltaproteobacteria bacterium]
MSSAQLLLRRLLEQAGGAAETGYLLVIDGEGLDNLPSELPTSKGPCAVHRVGTEIGLRHLLWKAKGAPLIAVLPEPVAQKIQASPDILRRARNQRVHALSVNDVLEVVLGVRVVGAEAPYMQQLALDNVEKLSRAMSKRTLPTVVDRRLLTELLVDASVGEQVRTKTPAELLASWVQAPPHWSDNVSQLVREALPTLHADEGRLLAWGLEKPDERLRQLLVHGAVLTVEAAELPKPAWGPFWRAATEAPINMDRRIVRRTLGALAEETLAFMGDTASPILAEADRKGRETLTPTQLQTSRVLPLAFADRCHTLAKQAAGGKAVSAAEIGWLAAHRAAPMHKADMEVLDNLARLSRFLDVPYSPKADVLEQVRHYQQQSAFADWAAVQLRRALAASAQYHAEANAVLEKMRARRENENRMFAETLGKGYEAALHREGLTPLHRLWKRTVAEVWQRDAATRLYLVVLDGCSYPVFLELLYALAQDSTFPLGIRADREGVVAGMPAIAPLPTVTSHARGAIFLGELPNDPLVAETVFNDQDEAKTDRGRFKQNAALQGRSRTLFLKGDLADGGQSLVQALEDDETDVVAAVFNAVDDQIGSSNTGATVRLRPEDIMGFKPSLKAAIKAKRKVLVTADHGHTPYIDKSLRAGAGKAARFTALGKNEPPPEGFIEIDVAGLGGPPERRAFAWRPGAYLGNPQVGFHGGCALEEMVVPLAWLEPEGLYADEPAWWFGGGAVMEERRMAPTPPPLRTPLQTPLPSDKIAPKKPTQDQPSLLQPTQDQLSLFNPADKIDTLGLPAPLVERLSTEERSVLVLLKENGSARASELAERLKKNPGRLNGLMVTLRRALHNASLVLFTDEVLPSGEILYRYTGAKQEEK